MTMTVKQVIDLLENNGWHCARIKGDHRMFVKTGARRPVVVAGKPSDDLAAGTLNSILREAGIK